MVMFEHQMFACCEHCYRGTGHVPPYGYAVHPIPCMQCGQRYVTEKENAS